MGLVRRDMDWDGDRLRIGRRSCGYSVVLDEKYPSMWLIRRPDGSLSDMVNRARAKDAAMAMLQRDLDKRNAPRTQADS